MKRFIVFLALTTVCSTSMAGFSTDSIEDWYEDLLEFFDLYRDRDEIMDKVDAYDEIFGESSPPDSQGYTASDPDPDDNLDDSALTEYDDTSTTGHNQSEPVDSDSSVVSNPEPCSIILSSLGLGIAGYLKRRRVI